MKPVRRRLGLSIGFIAIALVLLGIKLAGYGNANDTQPNLTAPTGMSDRDKTAANSLNPFASQEIRPTKAVEQAPAASSVITKDAVISTFSPAGQQVLRRQFGELISTAEMAQHQFSVEAVRCSPQSCNVSLRAPASFGAGRNNAAIADLLALASKSGGALGGTFGISSISHLSEGTEVQLALTRNDDHQLVTLTQEQIAKLRLETLQQYINESKEPPPK